MGACISSRITMVIHVKSYHQINYNCFNEPFAVSPYKSLYWDMHGLVFKTSIWLLAGSTRLQLLRTWYCWMISIEVETARGALELSCVNLVHTWAACFKSMWAGCDKGIISYSESGAGVDTASMHWGTAETVPHVMTQMVLISMILDFSRSNVLSASPPTEVRIPNYS